MTNFRLYRQIVIAFGIFVGSTVIGPLSVFPAHPAAAAQTSATAELALWNSIKDSGNAADFRNYLSQYPNGMFADIATAKIQALGSTSGSNESKVKPQDKKAKLKVKRHRKKRAHHATGKAVHLSHKLKGLHHPRHKLRKAKHVSATSPIDNLGHGGHGNGGAGSSSGQGWGGAP